MADQSNAPEGKAPGAQTRSEGRGDMRGREPDRLDFSAEQGVQAARTAARVNAQLIERNVESAQQAMKIGLQTTTRAFESLAKVMTETFSLDGAQGEPEEMAQNIQAASQAGAGLTIAAQEASREWLDLARRGMEANLEAFRELTSCRSVHDVASVQSKLVRRAFEEAVHAGQTIVSRSQRSLEEASRSLR
ncbi:MAG: phasin family protein [Caulobacteraceae bacterium]|nr:phasin family protein [Caulobacteraceae bacterium]